MISIIVACDPKGVIGKNGVLPWRCKDDLKMFRERTMNCSVIMGRKTWDSIPQKPLHGRANIVISRSSWGIPNEFGPYYYSSISAAIKSIKNNGNLRDYKNKDIFIIGGGEIYKQAIEINIVEKIYMSRIKKEYEGDIFFPKLNESWVENSCVDHGDFFLSIYEKII